MALAVNNNTSAFNVFASYTGNVSSMKQSMARLSTGTISVLDDPSGVGISERMRSQIRSTSMSRNNVQNGVSLLQTADSWLQKINDMLNRMHELAVEAEDGTKTTKDVRNIQTEFQQLQSENTRITSRSTAAGKYNGLFLFRGGNGRQKVNGDEVNSGSITIQIGAEVSQSLGINVVDLQVTNTDNIGTVAVYSYSTDNAVTGSSYTTVQWGSIVDTTKMSITSDLAIGKIAKAIDHVANNRAQLGAQQNRLEQTHSGLLAYEDNLRTAESKIRDVDMAKESTEFSKYQILTQISNAMLSQANQLPASAVQLVG